MPESLAVGNWKMHGLDASLAEARTLVRLTSGLSSTICICPPATLLHRFSCVVRDSSILLGGQNCHELDTGACTGEISAPMLADAGASFVILGHSERRAQFGETDRVVALKAMAAQSHGLTPILCVGESWQERSQGKELEVVAGQLGDCLGGDLDPAGLVVAYEPIWAIGSGKVPEIADIATVHAHLRRQLAGRFGTAAGESIPQLYGGSVNPPNAASIFAAEDVDGCLVGGASLRAADFARIAAELG